jgi:hypothetical protein
MAIARQKELAKREENIECRKFQEKQAEENAKRRAVEQAERLRLEHASLQKVKQEDDNFAKFALQEIEKFKTQGNKSGTQLLKKAINA